MYARVGVVGLALGALVLTACGRGLTPIDTGSDNDTSADTDVTQDTDGDTVPDRDTDDPDTDDPDTDDPDTDDPDTDACIPDCSGQVCGDDGCGDVCGVCGAGSECSPTGDQCLPDSVECRTVQIDDNLQAFAPNKYFATNVAGTAEMQAQFYTAATGTFSLVSGVNSNFQTCEQCVLYVEDGAVYYQSAGTINVADDPLDAGVALTLAGVQLVESTIDDTSLVSTPVVGGECIELASPLSLEAVPPAPETCDPIALSTGWALADPEIDGWFFAELDPTGTFDEDVVEIWMEFFTNDTGVIDLATGANANYSTCNQCVTVRTSDTVAQVGRSFYATGGTMNITSSAPTGSTITATINDLTLEEVTIAEGTFQSTPVVDGQCLEGPASITVNVPAR